MEVIERARLYIAKMNPAIENSGGHAAIFSVAIVLLHGWNLEKGTALALLTEWNSGNAKPPFSAAEIQHKIDSAAKTPPSKPVGYLIGQQSKHGSPSGSKSPASRMMALPLAPAPWPERDYEKILALLDDSFYSIHELEALSPIPPSEESLSDPLAIIDNLFLKNAVTSEEKDPLLCVSKKIQHPYTLRRSELQDIIPDCQFIVPSTMRASTGKTRDGKESKRCLENVSGRRYLVIECDFELEKDKILFDWLAGRGASVADLCATVLIHLSELFPMCCVCSSGNKSLHGWFPIGPRSEREIKKAMRYACLLGADKATFSPIQWVRLPAGTRDNKRPQTVHFFDTDLMA